jgi:hypothetical protein
MTKKESRLDVPGFAFGIKTGEFIDVPKIYGGRPTPKRSGKPHALAELTCSLAISRARKAVQLATKIAKEDYFRRKRARNRELKKAITNSTPPGACNRRFFEHMGMKASFLAYKEKPELFISRSKVAYEITDGFCPMVTTTSAREALIICASLARYGIAAYFNKIAILLT